MQKGKGNWVVLYIRVSTDEQANGPLNLENQERRCREYCQRQGWLVVKVFTDSGESARTVDRPEFQRMLAYCRANRREVRFVVVQDLSRFARNNLDQAQTIAELGRIGVLLRSTYEGNINETAAGKLATSEQRHRVQNLLFEDGLVYSADQGILGRSKCSLFSTLEATSDEK